MGRFFSAMLDKKIRSSVSQYPKQKGITKEDECKSIAILNKVLVNMKVSGGGVMTIVDVSKTFDTVPHMMIEEGLKIKSIPAMSRYIEKIYNDTKTTIHCRGKKTVTVDLLRGIK